jgi:outer membrane receptor protein involved in Fe transport
VKKFFAVIRISLPIVFAALCIFAQAGQRLTGVVRDQNGAPVSGVKITFKSVDNQKILQTLTDASGHFDLGPMPAISGTITAESRGFIRVTADWNPQKHPAETEIPLSPLPITEKVTITQTPNRIEETPESVVAISRIEIESTAAQTIDDKLRQIPGFTLFRRTGSRTANPTTQGVSLRGTGPSGASRALVLVDGVPVNDPFGGWVYWGRISSESVSQIEVLRGPAGDLYGSAAIGGVVAVTTKEPSRVPALDLDLSYGNENTTDLAGFASAGLGKWLGSLSSEAFRTDGFISVDETQRGLADTRSNVSRLALSPTIEYRFGERARIFAAVGYYEERRQNGTPLQNNDTRIQNLTVGADNAADGFGNFSFRAYSSSQIYHQSFSAVAADRNSEALTRLQTVPAQIIGFNGKWSVTLWEKYVLLSGIDAHEVRGRSDETGFSGGRATSISTAGGREFTFGGYIGTVVPVGQRLSLSGGIRYDRWRNYSGHIATQSLTSAQTTESIFAVRSEGAVSPRVSALFRATRNVAFTASFATGFRQPTLNELYRAFRVGDVLTLSNENLRAEHARNGEGGVIITAIGERLYGRANVFCNEVSDPVANTTLSVSPNLITRQRQNLGRIRACGVESDAQLKLKSDLSVSAGYLLVDSRVVNFPSDRSLEGLRVPQVARHQFTAQVQYSAPRIANVGVQFRAGSAQFDDDRNQFRLAGFFTVDAFVAKRLGKHFDLYAASENVFDAKIEAARTPLLSLTSPRTLRIGVRFRLK